MAARTGLDMECINIQIYAVASLKKHDSAPVWQAGPAGRTLSRTASWSQSRRTSTTSKLLKLEPGLAFPPSPRNPFAVVPWNVEFEKVNPPEVAVAPGAHAAPKQPLVKPAMNTSSARATPWPRVKTAAKAPASDSDLRIVVTVILNICSSCLR